MHAYLIAYFLKNQNKKIAQHLAFWSKVSETNFFYGLIPYCFTSTVIQEITTSSSSIVWDPKQSQRHYERLGTFICKVFTITFLSNYSGIGFTFSLSHTSINIYLNQLLNYTSHDKPMSCFPWDKFFTCPKENKTFVNQTSTLPISFKNHCIRSKHKNWCCGTNVNLVRQYILVSYNLVTPYSTCIRGRGQSLAFNNEGKGQLLDSSA